MAKKAADHEGRGIVPKALRLVEVHGKLGQFKTGEMPTNGTQEAELAIHSIDLKNRMATVAISFRFTLAYQEAESMGPPPLQITARYAIQYATPDRIDQQELEKAFHRTAIGSAWPYWSELLQSLSMRLGLPPFQVPSPPPDLMKKKEAKKTASKK